MKTIILLCSIGLSIAVTSAQAQYRPMPPDPYDPAAIAPAAAAPATQAGVVPGGVAGVAIAPSYQPAPYSNNDYPVAEVQAVPIAKARVTLARAQMELARRSLGSIIDELKEDFEYSANFLAATQDLKTAQDDYEKARNRVLVQLYDDPQYRALMSLRDQMSRKIEQLRANASYNRSEIVATASVKLDYATQLSDREAAALAADASAQDARRRFTDAGGKVMAMRAKFTRTVRREPAVVAARRDLDSARIDYLTSDALLVSAVDAREIALDYAYWIHRYDLYRNLHVNDAYDNLYPYSFAYGGLRTRFVSPGFTPLTPVMLPR